MSSELPKLLGKVFVVGYLMPTIIGLVAMAWLPSLLGIVFPLATLPWWHEITSSVALTISTVVLASTVVAYTLVLLNRPFLQFFEGYGRLNPLKLMARIERARYRRLELSRGAIREDRRQRRARGELIPLESSVRLATIMRQLAVHFPPDVWMLPTKLGNTMRAAETYSSEMYGLDAIVGWNRLLAVMPADWREQVDGAKAELDFWINIRVLTICLAVEYAALAAITRSFDTWWVLVGVLIAFWISKEMARYSAEEWGDYLKASFDVYLPQLREQLGLPAPASRDEERKQWQSFTRAADFRRSDYLPPIAASPIQVQADAVHAVARQQPESTDETESSEDSEGAEQSQSTAELGSV